MNDARKAFDRDETTLFLRKTTHVCVPEDVATSAKDRILRRENFAVLLGFLRAQEASREVILDGIKRQS